MNIICSSCCCRYNCVMHIFPSCKKIYKKHPIRREIWWRLSVQSKWCPKPGVDVGVTPRRPACGSFCCFLISFGVTGELCTLRQLMKVPNEPGLSPNSGLENVSLSDQSMASNPRKGQAKYPGAETTSHDDGSAGHVMTHVCQPSNARNMVSAAICVPMQGTCTSATGRALWPAKSPRQAMKTQHVILEHGGP